jgi:hypothetical protein
MSFFVVTMSHPTATGGTGNLADHVPYLQELIRQARCVPAGG